MKDTKIHLCSTCIYDFASCTPDNIKFGDNVGNDNVIECDEYTNKEGNDNGTNKGTP